VGWAGVIFFFVISLGRSVCGYDGRIDHFVATSKNTASQLAIFNSSRVMKTSTACNPVFILPSYTCAYYTIDFNGRHYYENHPFG
jgi:hypothetical protein